MDNFKWTREHLDFVKEGIDYDLSPAETAHLFEETFEEECKPFRGRTDARQRSYMINCVKRKYEAIRDWAFDYEELVPSLLKTKGNPIPWTEEEILFLKDMIIKEEGRNTQGEDSYKEICIQLFLISGKKRTQASIRTKKCRIRTELGKSQVQVSEEALKESYPLHPNLELLEPLNKGAYYMYEVKCNKGHITRKPPSHFQFGCNICKGSFVGGLPDISDTTPTVVYLIYVKEFDAVKIGYATGEGESAIHTRFNRNKLPYPYKILAYTQGEAGKIARYEQNLLYKTFDSRRFIEPQEFAGSTEFRWDSILEDILPKFETVLDISSEICYNIKNKKLKENYG